MVDTLAATEARRFFLAAQGLARRRPVGKVGIPRFREYLDRQAVLQLDSVNVLARAHHLPVFSRFGPYDREEFDRYLWESGETFEHWGHEASVMPRRLLPLLRHRMGEALTWKHRLKERLDRERPGFVNQVRAIVEDEGPVTASYFGEAHERRGPWWDRSHAKLALEYLFITGQVAVAGRPRFARTYDSPARVWGTWASAPGLPAPEARQTLFELVLPAVGVGTPADLADHFRLPKGEAQSYAETAVEKGLATWVRIDGWTNSALLAMGSVDPGRATGAALLSPFDPVCWYRDRLLRMFGIRYRIEIYTPKHRRTYGYYCHPFLLGDQVVARVDLKADRKGGVLLVQSSWLEPEKAPGSRRRPEAEVAHALRKELRLTANWLGLDDVSIGDVGTLAPVLQRAEDR